MGFFRKIIIKDEERGFLFLDGLFSRMLTPGVYNFSKFKDITVTILNINSKFFIAGYNIDFFLKFDNIAKELLIVDVKNYEIALHYENEVLKNVYTAGKHGIFKGNKNHEIKLIDKRSPEIDIDIDRSILTSSLLYGHIITIGVFNYEAGLLYFNNKFQKILTEGIYYFWSGIVSPQIIKVDLRQQQIEIAGQELMTSDKITLRLNFISHYKIVDPEKLTHTVNNYSNQIYILLQLLIREYVGSLSLDEILKNKQEIGNYILEKIKEKGDEFGIKFIFCGVKDIILPGEIKDILNTVLIAEKKSQANMITRREETASTRSLLNTAKLLDENKTLYRLKEMEYIEKIFDKISTVSLVNNGNVLEQIQALIIPNK
jgi:regulator of protease activity HflC (stomatin/prohibitin superfamily)